MKIFLALLCLITIGSVDLVSARSPGASTSRQSLSIEPPVSSHSTLPRGNEFLAVISLLSLASILRWRKRFGKKNVIENEPKVEKNTREIEAIAKKFQQRLPENRVIRDRISDGAPRFRTKPSETLPATNPFSQPRNAYQPKVLIIDEVRELRSSIANQLGHFYSTLESKDLEEAVRIVRIARPSLIILGMQNTKQDCMTFCRKLKSDSTLWHIPILLLVAKKSNPDAMQLIKATDDYLITPLQPEELLVAVENLVDVRAYLERGGIERPVISSEDSTTQIADTMFLDAVHTVVEQNLSNSLFGLETLAQEVNVSIRQLHGRLRLLTRLSPAGFIRTKRLKRASELLTSDNLNVHEVARMVGFHSPEYFHRVFRQAYGVSPADYGKDAA